MLPPVPKKMIQRWVVIGVSVLENCRQCFEPRCPTKPAIRYSSCESEPDLNCIIHHQLLMAFIKPSPANNAPRSRHHRGFWMKHFLRLCTVCEREAVQRRGNVQMRQKERIPRVADAWSEFILTMLAEDLFGAICHRLVRFPSSHSLHCYALSRERKSPEKVGDLWKVTQWLIQSGWQGLTAWNFWHPLTNGTRGCFWSVILDVLGFWSDPCCGESNGNMDISNDWSPIAPWFCNPIGQMCSLVGFFNQMHGQYPLGTLVHWYRCGGGEVVCSLCRLSALQLYISSLGWLIYRPITGHRVGLMAIKVEQLAIWAKAYRERTLRYKIETVWCPAFLNGGQIQFATWTNTFCTPR